VLTFEIESVEYLIENIRKQVNGYDEVQTKATVVMQTFAKAYPDFSITQEVLAQITWYHNITLLDKVKNYEERLWYVHETAKNGWSRNVLVAQIQTDLYKRQGKSVNNFQNTLPSPQSDLAQSIIKDPYNLQFLDIQGKVAERELETKLIDHIRKFLLELGQGFAFIGNQYHIELEGEDYYIDLLFYHVKLKCYVVIELKTGKFKPEYAGKLNFYLNLIDRQVKDNSDNPTIGLILCEDKKNITVEYAIEGINKPMGVSGFKLTEKLPEQLKQYLPTEEVLAKLKQ
jgi:predicted nuclease of restriction endonuclease-like (RecB) superfamily